MKDMYIVLNDSNGRLISGIEKLTPFSVLALVMKIVMRLYVCINTILIHI